MGKHIRADLRETGSDVSELDSIGLRDKVTGEWRKLYEVLNNMDCSPNIIQVIKLRRMRWAGDVAYMGKRRGTHRVLVEKPEGRRPLGRWGHRWEDNIKIDLQEVGWKVWIDVVHDTTFTRGRHF